MTDNTLYKRLAKAEAMAELQKSELTETLQAAYERACADENAQDAAAYARKLRDRLLELRGEAPMKDDVQNRRHRRRERTRKSEH